MPTYTYVCKKCGAEVEAFQSMTDPPLKRCRQCRGALQRTFHPVGIVLKGSGFHRNDYPRSGSRSRSRDGKDEGSSASKSEGSKSESGSKGEGSTGSDASTSGAKGSSSSSDD